jgi:alanine racemase
VSLAAQPIEERLTAAGLPPLPRLAWLEIDLDALAGNLAVVRGLVPAATRIAAVVKGDAYGHGLTMAARTFAAAGADLLCVATLDEALALRAAGITAAVLVLFPVPAGGIAAAADAGLDIVATDARSAADIAAARLPQGRDLRVHLEVETGLSRGGVAVASVAEVARTLLSADGVRLAGLWSHLASADDAVFTARQREQLSRAAGSLAAAGMPVPPLHLDATGGLLFGTGETHAMVRPGLCLYGSVPDSATPWSAAGATAAAGLWPAMSLHARPIRVAEVPEGSPVGYGGLWSATRPSRVATLPVGYGDGYVRGYQPGAEALVRGRRVPLVGSIAMDAVAVDVTEIPGVDASDEFVLLGSQGGETIGATELARRRNTIPWEVLSGMAYRLPRVYDASAGLRGVRTLAGEFLVLENAR